ncbi:MAG: hypothetical protein L3V56_02735 [Candidatus Magnetoovum sp. WYHC-5]|nr:hypothetical protein [Candidatus Magnetoovum sp. WYHC-5]
MTNDDNVKESKNLPKKDVGVSSLLPNFKDTPFMPVIKGLDILRRDESANDIEKTVTSMYEIVQSMEEQLHRVISINKLLEMDIKDAKEIIANLKEEKEELQNRLRFIENEFPINRELQMEIEHLIEERNNAQFIINDMKHQLEKTQQMRAHESYQNYEDRQKGMMDEITFLERKLNKAIEHIDVLKKENIILKNEKGAQLNKIITLEKDLALTLEEKDILFRELTKSQTMLSDIRSKFSEYNQEG